MVPGDVVADFELPDQAGTPRTLSGFLTSGTVSCIFCQDFGADVYCGLGMPADGERKLHNGVRLTKRLLHIATVLFHDGGLGRSAGLELAGRPIGCEHGR